MPGKEADDWKKTIEKSLGRDLTANERRQLQAVDDLLEELQWRDGIYAKDLEVFAPEIKLKVDDPTKPLSEGLWLEKPKDQYSLLNYIAFILEERDALVPEVFTPVADTSAIRRELSLRSLQKETRLWRNRLSNLSQPKPSDATPGLEVRLKLSGKTLKWEARRAGSTNFDPLTAKDFGNWLGKGYGFLERFAPESIALCSLFQEYYQHSQRARLDLDKDEDAAFLNRLLHHPATKNKIVGRDGEPLSVSDVPLQWTGSEEGPDEDGIYSIRLQLATGDPAPFPLVYLAGQRPLYLHSETLYLGPTLLRANEDPNRVFRIPSAALEAPEGLLFLRNQGLPLPPSVKGKVVAVPLQTRLYGSIRTESTEWSSKRYFDAKLVAVSPDQRYWFSLTDDGWEKSVNLEDGSPSLAAPEGTLFEYPPSAYVSEILSAFDLEEIEDAGLWSREIDSGFPNAFVEWIQSLPSNIQIIADEELDSLVDNQPAGRYRLAIEGDENSDWFNLRLDPDFQDTSLSAQERELVMKAAGAYTYLPGKGWKRFETEVAPENQELLESLGIQFDDTKRSQHALHTLQLADARLEDTAFDDLRENIRKRSKELSAKTPAKLPRGIRSELRPYQVEGFKFLAFLSHNRFGGVLADDMGLGKTLQTLTWLTWLKLNRPADEPFTCLVVCPKSVMHVWQQEVATHATELSIALFDPERFFAVGWQAAGIDILVANYSQLRIQRDFFLKQTWTVAILDEAQYIKNPQSQTARTARDLKAKHRIALTGTPVENRSADLWSIFAYAMPALLGSRATFAKQYRENDPDTPSRLANRVRHFMIRRSKKQVAPDLPERIEEALVCDMEGEQRDLYTAELKLAQQKLMGLDSGAAFDRERFNILASLLRLRQICCHPRLIDPAYAKMRSSKLDALLDHVAELREEGHKVLIFSQFVEMLKIISESLEEIKCPHLILTGQTQNREELVERFQKEDSQTAFLLSLRAAGSGLNLTAASYVFLYDPWWNPAVEAQAIDRTHRIGQKNTVNAYRLIAKGSVEQKIQALQHKKEALANEIVREESLSQILDLNNLKFVLGE